MRKRKRPKGKRSFKKRAVNSTKAKEKSNEVERPIKLNSKRLWVVKETKSSTSDTYSGD